MNLFQYLIFGLTFIASLSHAESVKSFKPFKAFVGFDDSDQKIQIFKYSENELQSKNFFVENFQSCKKINAGNQKGSCKNSVGLFSADMKPEITVLKEKITLPTKEVGSGEIILEDYYLIKFKYIYQCS